MVSLDNLLQKNPMAEVTFYGTASTIGFQIKKSISEGENVDQGKLKEYFEAKYSTALFEPVTFSVCPVSLLNRVKDKHELGAKVLEIANEFFKNYYKCTAKGVLINNQQYLLDDATEHSLVVVIDDNIEHEAMELALLESHKTYSCFSGDIHVMSKRDYLKDCSSKEYVAFVTTEQSGIDEDILDKIDLYQITSSESLLEAAGYVVGNYNSQSVSPGLKKDSRRSLVGDHPYSWLNKDTLPIAHRLFEKSIVKPDIEQWARHFCQNRDFDSARKLIDFSQSQSKEIKRTIDLLQPVFEESYSERPEGVSP